MRPAPAVWSTVVLRMGPLECESSHAATWKPMRCHASLVHSRLFTKLGSQSPNVQGRKLTQPTMLRRLLQSDVIQKR